MICDDYFNGNIEFFLTNIDMKKIFDNSYYTITIGSN